jgi:hypothetical protein
MATLRPKEFKVHYLGFIKLDLAPPNTNHRLDLDFNIKSLRFLVNRQVV